MNYTIPLQLIGNRSETANHFFKLVIEAKNKNGRYKVCYDLFAGVGALTLFAIQYDLAECYVFNNTFIPLSWFWLAVQKEPQLLIESYQQHLANHEKDFRYYQKQQEHLNHELEAAELNITLVAARFAFIVNCAKDKMQLDDKNTFICQTGMVGITGKRFEEDINRLHYLIKDKAISFSQQAFITYQETINTDDIVLLDPLYFNNKRSVQALQHNLQSLIVYLEGQKTDFCMFYGILGQSNLYPIRLPKGHVLSIQPQQASDTFIEHLYLSQHLATLLTDNVESGIDSTQSYIQPLFYRFFEVHAQPGHHANDIALVWEGKKYTYERLNQAVNRLANYLLNKKGLDELLHSKKQANQDLLIALYLPRGPQLITAILAVMKTGAAYLPLDSEKLDQTVAYERFNKSQASFLLTLDDMIFKELQSKEAPKVISTTADDALWQALTQEYSEINPNCAVQANSLAYVMYTSGSTGTPKGVEILHRGLTFAYESHQDLLNLDATDRIIQFSSIGFDASLMEIMMALGSGASLYLASKKVYQDKVNLSYFLQDAKITVMIQTPAMLQELDENSFPTLRAVLIVGDKFGKELVDKWLAPTLESGQSRQVINGYGLTETTICTTLEDCKSDKALTIGEPILGLNIRLRALEEEEHDQVLKSCTINHETRWLGKHNVTAQQQGAIYVSGVCLARGYWQQPVLTQKRFVSIIENGQTLRLYQTGDIGYFTQEGGIVIARRLDRQIKLRGQRLELDEIEIKLNEIDEFVANVRVVIHPQGEDKQLAVYLVPQDKRWAELDDQRHLSKEAWMGLVQLQQELKAKVPSYAVIPISHMLWVKELLVKEDDKKNYHDQAMKDKWPLPCHHLPFTSIAWYEQLTSEQQYDVARIREQFAGSLGLANELIGFEHDYFAWGGSSITVKRLFEMLKKINYKTSFLKEQMLQLVISDFTEQLSIKSIWDYACLKAQLKCLERGNLRTPPLYLIHSIIGDGHDEYEYFARELAKSYSAVIYGLRFPGYYNSSLLIDESIESIAEQHVNLLLKQQYTALGQPYFLLGWSSGGLIAFEIARQLKLKGYTVYVYLIDTLAPKLLQQTLQHATDLVKHLARLAEVELNSGVLTSLFNIKDSKELISQAFPLLEQALASHNPKYREIQIAKAIALAEQSYQLQSDVMPNTLRHFIATETAKEYVNDPNLGWADFSIECQKISADHFNLLKQPFFIEKIVLALEFDESCYRFQTLMRQRYAKPIRVKSLLSNIEWELTPGTYVDLDLEERVELQNELQSSPTVSYQAVELNNIFKQGDNPSARHHVLLEGEPGSGKTLSLRYLSGQWANKLLCQQYDYILYIALPQLLSQVENASFIEKDPKLMLLNILCREFSDINFYLELRFVEELANHGKLLLLLDGFDKVVQHWQKDTLQGAVLVNLFAQHKWHWLITSTPGHRQLLNPVRVIHNKGFASLKTQERYLAVHVKDQERAILRKYLQENPQLAELARLPLNLDIISHLPCDKLLSLGQRLKLNALYKLIVEAIFEQYLKHHPLQNEPLSLAPENIKQAVFACLSKGAIAAYFNDQILSETIWVEVADSVSKQFQTDLGSIKKQLQLSKVQYSGITQQFMLLANNGEVYLQTNNLLKEMHNSGFIHPENQQFFHLTFQDYFAAQWLAKQLKQLAESNRNDNIAVKSFFYTSAHQLRAQILKKNNSKNNEDLDWVKAIEFINTHKNTANYEIFWGFVAGMLSGDEKSLRLLFKLLFSSTLSQHNKAKTTHFNHTAVLIFIRCVEEANLSYDELDKKLVKAMQQAAVDNLLFADLYNQLRIHTYLKLYPNLIDGLIKKDKFIAAIKDESRPLQQSQAVLTAVELWPTDSALLTTVIETLHGKVNVYIGKHFLLALTKMALASAEINLEVIEHLMIGYIMLESMPYDSAMETTIIDTLHKLIEKDFLYRHAVLINISKFNDKLKPFNLPLFTTLVMKSSIFESFLQDCLINNSFIDETTYIVQILSAANKISQNLFMQLLEQTQINPQPHATSALQAVKAILAINYQAFIWFGAWFANISDKSSCLETLALDIDTLIKQLIISYFSQRRLLSHYVKPINNYLALTDSVQLQQTVQKLLRKYDDKQIIAILLTAMDDKSHNKLSAIKALRNLGFQNDTIFSALIKAFDDENSDIRLMAIKVLSHFGFDKVTDLKLLKALDDKNYVIRIIAIRVLIDLGTHHELLIHHLMKYIFDDNDTFRAYVLDVLKFLSINSDLFVDNIIKQLDSYDDRHRLLAVSALSELGISNNKVINSLIDALNNENTMVIFGATFALMRFDIKDDVAINKIVSATLDNKKADSDDLILINILIKASVHAQSAVNGLIKIMEITDSYNKLRIIKALGKLGIDNSIAMKGIIKAIDDKDYKVSAQAIRTLRKAGINFNNYNHDKILKALNGKNSKISAQTSKIVMKFRSAYFHKSTTYNILTSTEDKESIRRKSAIEALTKLGIPDEIVLKLIIKVASNDKDHNVRKSAMRALGKLGNNYAPAIKRLKNSASSDDNYHVRYAAVVALEKIATTDSSLFPIFIKILDDESSLVKLSALGALQKFRINSDTAVSKVINLITEDIDYNVRKEALLTVGELGITIDIAVNSLIKAALYDVDPLVRGNALLTLCKLNVTHELAINTFINALDDKVVEIKLLAIECLCQPGICYDLVIDSLIRALDNISPNVRAQALIALGQFEIRSDFVVNKLINALDDEVDNVVFKAIWVLKELDIIDNFQVDILINSIDNGADRLIDLLTYVSSPMFGDSNFFTKRVLINIEFLTKLASSRTSAALALLSVIKQNDGLSISLSAVQALTNFERTSQLNQHILNFATDMLQPDKFLRERFLLPLLKLIELLITANFPLNQLWLNKLEEVSRNNDHAISDLAIELLVRLNSDEQQPFDRVAKHKDIIQPRPNKFSKINVLPSSIIPLTNLKQVQPLQALIRPTKGGGDCAFHASLGEWDESKQQFVCKKVREKRQCVKEAVITSMQKPNDPILLSVQQAIQEAIMDAVNRNKNFNHADSLNELANRYRYFKLQQDQDVYLVWQQLEANDELRNYVNQHGADNRINKTIKDRYMACLNNDRQSFEQQLIQWNLYDVYQHYNSLQNKEFEWATLITETVIHDYVNVFIIAEGQWLLPGELNIIAHVFGITIDYYPTYNSEKLVFNPGQTSTVKLAFNGFNHFERIADTELITSKITNSHHPYEFFPSQDNILSRNRLNDVASQKTELKICNGTFQLNI